MILPFKVNALRLDDKNRVLFLLSTARTRRFTLRKPRAIKLARVAPYRSADNTLVTWRYIFPHNQEILPYQPSPESLLSAPDTKKTGIACDGIPKQVRQSEILTFSI